jgi:hypothetical protein
MLKDQAFDLLCPAAASFIQFSTANANAPRTLVVVAARSTEFTGLTTLQGSEQTRRAAKRQLMEAAAKRFLPV